MAEVIEMIQLSPTMDAGMLVEWLKKEGDTVSVGELIAEVETDKTSMEMESFFDGTILKILAQEGSSIKVGRPLAIVGEPGEDIQALLQSLGDSGSDEPASAPAPAPEAHAPKAAAQPKADAPSPKPKSEPEPEAQAQRASADASGRLLSSPVARRIAQDNDLTLAQIEGSGPAGRIVKRDVEAALAAEPAAAQARTAPSRAGAMGASATAEALRLTPMRKAIARNTTEAWKIPAFMLTRTIRMDAALAFRKDVNASLQRAGKEVSVSVNDLVIKAAALALQDMPEVNVAFVDDQLLQYSHSRIGVAVAIDGGLLTPVVEAAELLPLSAIAASVRDLAGRAKSKKLAPEEYSNASFSISNLGMFGIDHFTAVLNPPGAAILAVGASKAVLVADDSERGFRSELQMSVTLTCDHRALDGAVGAQWLQRFAAYLEEPLTMVL